MSEKRASLPVTSAATSPSSGVLLLVALALGVYLVAFHFWPLSGHTGTPMLLRRGHVFVSLFLGDETVASWFAGASWHSLAQRGEILSYAAIILLAATAIGWLMLLGLRLADSLTRLETLVYSSGVGLNVVSLATLLSGLAGMMERWVFLCVAGVAIVSAGILFWRRQAPVMRPGADTAGALRDELVIDRRWLWLAAPFVAAILLGAMLPPIDFDVREYHLQAPKEFFQNGRITFLAHNVYANMPLGAEMLSLAGMIACDDWWTGALVGKTLIASYAPLTAGLLLAAGRRWATPTVGIIAALAYISIPWMALVAMQGLVDGVVAFYLFAALHAALAWRDCARGGESPAPWLMLAGFMSGAAVSVKYPAVVFSVLPIGLGIGYESARAAIGRRAGNRKSGWSGLVAPLIFLGAAGVACGPWLLKNAVLAGNPTYPLLYEWFGGATRSEAKNHQWTRVHSPPNYDLSDFARRAAGITFTSDWLSPIVIPLAVLSGMRWRRMALVRTLWIYFGYVIVCWWLFTHRIDRFWIPALPLAALAAGIGAAWTSVHPWRLTLAGFLGLGLLANFSVITSGILGDNRFLADLDTLRNEVEASDPWHRYLNEHAAEVERVLLVGDAQPFDLNVPVEYNTVFDDCVFELLAREKSADEIREALFDRGISHVYVAWGEVGRYRSPGNYGFTKFVDPALFEALVRAGALEELPAIKDNPGQLFRVKPPS
jgi:hypothetical protein